MERQTTDCSMGLMRVTGSGGATLEPLQRTTKEPFGVRPAARSFRLVPGSFGAGMLTKFHMRPPSSLFQHSAAPSQKPWQGLPKMVATMESSGIRVRLGQAHLLSTATKRSTWSMLTRWPVSPLSASAGAGAPNGAVFAIPIPAKPRRVELTMPRRLSTRAGKLRFMMDLR